MGGRRGRPRKLLPALRTVKSCDNGEEAPPVQGGEDREKMNLAGVGDLAPGGESSLSTHRVPSRWGDESKMVDSGVVAEDRDDSILPAATLPRAGEATYLAAAKWGHKEKGCAIRPAPARKNCFRCGRPGHRAVECRVVRKDRRAFQQKVTQESSQDPKVTELVGGHVRLKSGPVEKGQRSNSEHQKSLEWSVVDAAKACRKGVAPPLTKSRQRRSFICSVVNAEGALVTSTPEIGAAFVDYFSGLMGIAGIERDYLDFSVILEGPILDGAVGISLDRDFGAADVWRALSEIADDKSPDGRQSMIRVTRGKSDIVKLRRICLAAVVYCIWCERNCRIFKCQFVEPAIVARRVMSFVNNVKRFLKVRSYERWRGLRLKSRRERSAAMFLCLPVEVDLSSFYCCGFSLELCFYGR
ncbi:hypothetical protein Dimus_011376 [Dionaea muscipula]